MTGGRRSARPISLLALALAVLAAACGGGRTVLDASAKPGDYKDTRVTTTLPPETTTTAVAGAVTGVIDGAAGPGATTAPSPTAPNGTPTTAGRTGTTFKVDTSPQDTDPIVMAARQGPGRAAELLLGARSPARTITIEIIASQGLADFPEATDRVKADVEAFSGKPVNLVRTQGPATSAGTSWDTGTLGQWADANSKVPQGGSNFTLRHLYVHGHLPSGNKSYAVLGVAFRGDSFAYFYDDAKDLSSTQKLAVAVHENGHIMGLVDNYLNRGRSDTTDDPAKHGHSKNNKSVMYWAIESSLIATLTNGIPTQFDDEDKKDLLAIHNEAAYGSNP